MTESYRNAYDFRRDLPLFMNLFLCRKSFLKHCWNFFFPSYLQLSPCPIGKSRKSFARLISQMLSHFSVTRIKDKTAHSSLNHLLFSAAVTLPPAQRSYCQDLHAGNSQRSFTHSHGLLSDYTRRRSRGRCSARRGRPACGTGFVPRVGHGSARAPGHAGAQPAGKRSPSCSAGFGSPVLA